MTVVGPRLKCARCREEMPYHSKRIGGAERIRLLSGPDENRLCQRHFNEAWDEHLDEREEGDDGA